LNLPPIFSQSSAFYEAITPNKAQNVSTTTDLPLPGEPISIGMVELVHQIQFEGEDKKEER
jgi:hypothetical protein